MRRLSLPTLIAVLSGCLADDPPKKPHPSQVRIDADEDGFTVDEGDCDDGDRLRAPGLAESCDGVDNDCDGLPDQDDTGFNACDQVYVVAQTMQADASQA